MLRSRGERDESENKPAGSATRDSSIGLVKILSILIIFVLGVVIGLTSSSHIDRYFTFQAEQFSKNKAAPPTPMAAPDHKCPTPQKCKQEDCLSLENFLQPKNLSHGMSDEQLFWRTSMVPKKEEYPYQRVPKVAFMFLTRGPLPLLPLWERFFEGQDEKKFSIYVHAPPGYELNVISTSVFYGRQIPSQNVRWGTVSLADAERRLLGNALLDFSNERFILLSESCIPVHNFRTVYDYLVGSTQSFVQSYDDPSRYGRGRYSRRMRPDIRLSDWRKGSQWFELNRLLAVALVSDTKYYNIFKKYCRPSCYPDEHYIPTFVNMFFGRLNSNRTLTWVDWSLGGPHPAKFGAANITPGFIQSIRNNSTICSYNSGKTSTCFLFARKFDPTTLPPLLNLTATTMGF